MHVRAKSSKSLFFKCYFFVNALTAKGAGYKDLLTITTVFDLKSDGMKGLVEKNYNYGFCASCADLLSSNQKSIQLL